MDFEILAHECGLRGRYCPRQRCGRRPALHPGTLRTGRLAQAPPISNRGARHGWLLLNELRGGTCRRESLPVPPRRHEDARGLPAGEANWVTIRGRFFRRIHKAFPRTMQFLFELAPVIAFIVAYKLGGIYVATATIMVAMGVVLAVDYLRTKRMQKMHGLSAVLVWVFGAATLILHDIRFIQWKPTIFYWLIAITLFGSLWIGKQPLLQRLMSAAIEDQAQISDTTWRRASLLCAAFYALLGVANLVLMFNVSESTWVKSKPVFIVVLFLFTFAQLFWLLRRPAPQTPSPQA
jgi:intracellular septation protein